MVTVVLLHCYIVILLSSYIGYFVTLSHHVPLQCQRVYHLSPSGYISHLKCCENGTLWDQQTLTCVNAPQAPTQKCNPAFPPNICPIPPTPPPTLTPQGKPQNTEYHCLMIIRIRVRIRVRVRTGFGIQGWDLIYG